MNIGSNVSALGAHQVYGNNNAHNVANVNTERYVPTRTTLHERGGDGVKAVSTKADGNGAMVSQTDLAKEMSEQISIEGGFEANSVAIRAQDDLLGTLLDVKA